MELKYLIKRMIPSYFIIYACSILGTLVFCLIFNPDAVFPLNYFTRMLLFSLAGDLPSLIFYSGEELNERQWRLRMLLHFLILEAVLLLFAGFWGLYKTFLQGCFFAVIVLAVYVIVRVLAFSGNLKTARKMNEKLKKLKEEP